MEIGNEGQITDFLVIGNSYAAIKYEMSILGDFEATAQVFTLCFGRRFVHEMDENHVSSGGVSSPRLYLLWYPGF